MIQMILMSIMWLFISILSEVFATSMLPQTRHFRRVIPTAFCASGSVRVGVYARDKHALRTLMPALETCKKEVEHQGFADLLFESLFKRQ